MSDPINPNHYKRLPVEAIEIIESAIANAPDNIAAYNHGQQLKYDLRLFRKGKTLREYLIDQEKHCWYADRLRDHLRKLVEQEDEREKQEAADLQSLKDHPFGKPKWTPKVGEWVKINKPKSVDDFLSIWMPGMDRFDGQIVEVKEIDDDQSVHEDWAYIGKAIIHDEWAFLFDWLEPAEAPINSDTIPEGYRRLNDSSEEPRQIGDLRWSVSEKRYIPISGDEICYANRDNWAACRKIETNDPPDGWRWLQRGEVIRMGDMLLRKGLIHDIEPKMLGKSCRKEWMPVIRRNKFEIGEKVVECVNNRIGVVSGYRGIGKSILYHVEMQDTKGWIFFSPNQIAPYIEDAK